MSWQQIELMWHVYYADQGYRILIPLVSSHGYDFVAEKDGEFIRVNVKTAGLKNRFTPNSWSISQASCAHGKHRDTNQVDIYLAWLPHQEKFIELSGDFLNGGNSKSKLVPKNLLM